MKETMLELWVYLIPVIWGAVRVVAIAAIVIAALQIAERLALAVIQ